MLILLLAACPTAGKGDDSGDTGNAACEAYPPPRFHVHVVDVDGAPATADRAWAEDPAGNVYEASCDDGACVDWTGIATDGTVFLYASAGDVVSLPVEDEIVRDDAACSVEEAEGTVVLDPCPDCD
ncbi:MAG: hypothetical protein ACOZNI_01495 [Myxococcota bacterium]